ncbi:MAG TPA: hypothetical protein VK901_09340 [Nitrospiraceae bacterium]|nr:hypothetical protein [Nitrospiraceae bacterium]
MNPQDNLRLIAMPHIISTEKGRVDVMRPAGGSVSDLMRSIAWTPDSLHARVFIDGDYIKDAAWEYTIPRPGQSVVVRAIPMGGGGGGGGKDSMRMVAMIGIMVAAIAAQQYWVGGVAGATGFAAFATTAGIALGAVGASLAITALIPQPLPRRALPQPVREWDLKEVAA